MAFEVEATSRLQVNGRDLGIINATDLPTDRIAADASLREVANQLGRWVEDGRRGNGQGSLFNRNAYTPPNNPYDEMRSARHAVRYDSIVSGVQETTEAFAFQGVKWEGEDPDEADIFNQLARIQNLDAVVRTMWREEFTYGQFVAAKLWGWTELTVRGKTKNGNKRKRKVRVWAPLQIRILDSLKIVPAGVGPLGGETLCWQATQGEVGAYQEAFRGEKIDPLMTTFFQGTYNPDYDETNELAKIGVDPAKLLAMNPDWVFRHTMTKPDYERFSDVRLKSLFTLLDLKRSLIEADRAMLIGAAKYILLIRKGEKDAPALPEEMANLQENYQFIAKLPVIISDHRLSIDIIAPKTDMTLNEDKYQTLDSRILARLLGTLTIGSKGRGSDDQSSLSYTVAKVMENRRHMLKRTLENQLAWAVVTHPKNAGVFETTPSLVYTPRNIALSMEQSYAQALLSLRTSRELSRETILEFFGLDQSTEAQRMQIEEEFYDDIFKTQVPYAAQGVGGVPPENTPGDVVDGETEDKAIPPAKAPAKKAPAKAVEPPAVSGARGGRPVGGGQSKRSPAAIAKPKTGAGNPKTGS